jgi:ribosomal protein S27AE
VARIEDGEIIEGGIECPNCGAGLTAAPSTGRSVATTDFYCDNCGYTEQR